MTATNNVQKLGGYDYEFTSNVPEDFECPVCQLPMKDPVQIVQCGHRFCSICMESLFRLPSPFCPTDRQSLSRDKIFPDTACGRKILDLIVKCPTNGCPWTGELRDVEEHQAECLYEEVQCPNSGCTEKLLKKDVSSHVESQCLWRILHCEYCQKLLIFSNKQKHFDHCSLFPVKCSNNCGLREIPRKKLEVHIRDECSKTEVHCEYKYLGCEAVFLRPNAKSHSESQVEGHLKLAVRSLEATQHQVQELVEKMERLMANDEEKSQHMERLKAEVAKKSKQMERLIANDEEKSQHMERLKAEVAKKSKQMERLLANDEEKSQQVAEKSQQMERLIARDDENTKQIEQLIIRDEERCKEMERLMEKVNEQSQQMERLRMTAKKCAPFVWKISSFQAVLDRANRGFHPQNILLSEKFYLTENGYKLRIKLVLFHKERLLSLYIRIVPGKFDSLLPWPFLDKVRVSFVDQNPCKEKREDLFRVLEFAKKRERVTKPVKDDKFDYGFNITHEVLRTRSYITNDTICIIVSKEN